MSRCEVASASSTRTSCFASYSCRHTSMSRPVCGSVLLSSSPAHPSWPSRDGRENVRCPGPSMMKSLAPVAYLEENLCPC